MKHVTLYRRLGNWRWKLTASNGEKIANGGQSFSRRIDCLDSVCNVLGAMRPDLVDQQQEFLLRHPVTDDVVAEGHIA